MSTDPAGRPDPSGLAVATGSAAPCPKCGRPGIFVRVRNFDTEDAAVWECDNPRCPNFHRLWHTPRKKSELGEMRCALLALVEAGRASRDNFDSNSIERIEQAMQHAERVLFPERFSQNIRHDPRPTE